jgi:hypothetical protein
MKVQNIGKGKCVPLHNKQAQGEGKGIALTIIKLDVRRGWIIRAMPWTFYPQDRENGFAPEPVKLGSLNLTSTGVRIQDSSARNESVYRLRHPGRHKV